MSEKSITPIAAQINRTASEKNIPQSVLIELTYACNLSCYYCYNDKASRKPVLETPIWKRVLRELAGAGCLYATFSGGEPFLRQDLFEIIKTARQYAFAVSLITNGTLLDDETVSRLAGLRLLDVGLSFHAADPDLHDALSGQSGSHAKTLTALKRLRTLGVKVAVKHTVSKKNFGQFRALAKIAESEGAHFECDSLVLRHGRHQISPYALDVNEQRRFLRFMKVKPAPLSGKANPDDNLHCDAGRSVMGISPFGDVYPCIQLPLSFGNVRHTSIREIWHGPRAERFRTAEERVAKECLACDVKAFCGRCPGLSFYECGEWQGKARVLCVRTKALRLRRGNRG